MAGWHRCYIPRARCGSNEHQLPLCPCSPSAPHQMTIGHLNAHGIIPNMGLSQGSGVNLHIVSLPDSHSVQQHRLPLGSTTVLRISIRPGKYKAIGQQLSSTRLVRVRTSTKLKSVNPGLHCLWAHCRFSHMPRPRSDAAIRNVLIPPHVRPCFEAAKWYRVLMLAR